MHVWLFVARAVVFHHGVGLEHVRTYLTSPFNLFHLAFYGVGFLLEFALAQFNELSEKHLHSRFAVLNLASLVLALHHYARGQMGYAHRGVGLVYVLTARAARAVGVHAQILGIYLYAFVVLYLGHNLETRKTRVPAGVAVKRRNAHKAVHALFGFEISVRVCARHAERNALYARFVAREIVEFLVSEPVLVGVHLIHAIEHLSPFLRLRAARARVQRENGVVMVVFAL